MTLGKTLTKRRIRSWAGSRSYERGEDYFLGGRVVRLSERNEKITAVVAGTHNYRVRLWADDDELDYACDCPVGSRDDFCKHCVAAALQWLQQNSKPTDGGQRRQETAGTAGTRTKQPDCRAWLMKQDKDTLADLLLDRAAEDEELHNRLLLSAAGAAADFNLAAHKKIIRQAVGRSRFIEYREMHDYWRRIDTVIDSIEELLDQGRTKAVVELSEYALLRVEQAIERVDDSDGYMGQLLGRLQDIHLAACNAAKPGPRALAEKLFAWELNGGWDTFRGAAVTYAGVLGEQGLKRYRELAEAEWAEIPPLGPGDEDPNRYGRRFNITDIMESLAHVAGGLDELIAIKQRDLSSSYRFLEIAEACRRARVNDQALAWAEKGLATFGKQTDGRLIELLATLYHEHGRHDDAVNLIWSRFERAPGLATYVQLQKAADHQQSWPTWRQRALEHIRGKIQQGAQDRPHERFRFNPWSDASLLVEIYVWEDDIEAAWQEACDGGCTEELWVELAQRREKGHPRDAIAIYQRQVGPIVERTNNKAYTEATVLIRRVKKLMIGSGSRAEFRQYLDTLRSDFKRKRNFMKMLDGM